jgi:hypothetical protein
LISKTTETLSVHYLGLFIALLTISTIVIAGCGSGANEDEIFPKISDPGRIFTLDDVLATPYKELNNYSTAELPGASEASYGFMRIGGGEPYDYEIRVYDSHEAAIERGTPMALEGTGKNAILSEDDAIFKEGIKDRRTIIGGGVGGGARSGIGPKFAAYAIFGNIIMLCQGSEPETSLERCSLMANALVPSE